MAKREDELSKEVIGAAIEVHRHLGPGLLESAYEECLCRELVIRSLYFEKHAIESWCKNSLVDLEGFLKIDRKKK